MSLHTEKHDVPKRVKIPLDPPTNHEVMTLEEAAAHVRLRPRSFEEFAHHAGIAYFRAGRKPNSPRRWRRKDIDAAIEKLIQHPQSTEDRIRILHVRENDDAEI